MPPQRKPRAFVLTLAALAALALAAPAAFAANAEYKGISKDGDVAVFSTVDSLVAGDTDIQLDVYVRSFDEVLGDYVTREVSLGPTGGNDSYAAQYLAVDSAGVFFSTQERLTADDKDAATDIYVRDLTKNETSLVSAGDASCASAGCGEEDVDVSPGAEGIVDEGRRVFLVSTERLSGEDTDKGADVYLRDLDSERTRLVSTAASSCGGCGAGTEPVVFQGASSDGSKAIFTTAEPLAGADQDQETDLYTRNMDASGSAGETKLVTTPGVGPDPCPVGSNCKPATSSISDDGSHVFFETGERIASIDLDAKQDVYDWSGGTAELASVGSAGQNGAADARFLKSAADGDKVFFATIDAFAPPDEDSVEDVYARTGGTATELVSEGDTSCATPSPPPNPSPGCGNGPGTAVLEWVSGDGSVAILATAEPLTAADTDTKADLYSRGLPGGPTKLVSLPGASCTTECGNGNFNASFSAASSDGSAIFFVTKEALAPPVPEGDPTAFGDGDEETDVYKRSGETTSLISLGQPNEAGVFRGNGELFPAQLRGVAATGAPAFFTTKEQLTEADEDPDEDVYQRSGGTTRLVSRSNTSDLEGKLAPLGPVLKSTNPKSPNVATSLRVIGSAPAETSVKLYATPQCKGETVANGSVAQLESPGLAVSVAAGSTTTFHATAESGGFVSPCSGEVTYRQKSEESPGGGGGGGGGPVLTPLAKAPSPPGPLVLIPQVVPQTRITFGPAFKTRIRRPVFRFTDETGQQGTKFICKLDRAAWKPCSSPLKLPKVNPGKHVFRVKGVNAVGVWEAQPTKRPFKLVVAR
jgi:hypothetical protein